MKFPLGLTWFSRSYYKFILFVIVKSELYFGGSDDRPTMPIDDVLENPSCLGGKTYVLDN